ncbi:hypothetical protein MG293_001846 [Ovis ammon polii]|uniref:Uncharacterized protein n=1 Tax=Ovis ammon polii TaxID=230172 RepID=A0AAD4UNT3_OVIAM|nr:hypothetical protein MG293_001846 [Ovis ammon polii]
MTERLHFHFPLSCIGKGNGNPLQCSCLKNPKDIGSWWTAVYGVSQCRTGLERLSSSAMQQDLVDYPSRLGDPVPCLYSPTAGPLRSCASHFYCGLEPFQSSLGLSGWVKMDGDQIPVVVGGGGSRKQTPSEVVTEYQVELTVLCSIFPLAIYFAYGRMLNIVPFAV